MASRRLRHSSGWASRSTPEYDFPPLAERDLVLIRRWLIEPHVRRWWCDPPRRAYPADEIDKYRQRIRGAGDPTDLHLIRRHRRPIGFIQRYRIRDYPDYAAAVGLEVGAIGIDLFIGERAALHRGYGPSLIRAFLRDVAFPLSGVGVCVIGPAEANAAAIRAYEKAGFTHFATRSIPGEPYPEHLMWLTAAQLT